MHIDELPFDVLHTVFSFLRSRNALYACTLVDKAFNAAATPILYRHVRLGASAENQLQNAETGLLTTLEDRPSLRACVRSLLHERALFLSSFENAVSQRQTASLEEIEEYDEGSAPEKPVRLDVLSRLPNVEEYTLRLDSVFRHLPTRYLAAFLDALSACSSLCRIGLDFAVGLTHTHVLKRVPKLKQLRLGFPNGAALVSLNFLPPLESLGIMSANDVEFVTMTRLTGLRGFTLGPKHALPSAALLTFLAEMQDLVFLDVFLDHFLDPTSETSDVDPNFPGLRNLRQLVVRHQGVGTRKNYGFLFRWISTVVSTSRLHTLSVKADDGRPCSYPARLLHMLGNQPELVVLDVPHVRLHGRSLERVLRNLTGLETLGFFLAEATDLEGQERAPSGLSAVYITSRLDRQNELMKMTSIMCRLRFRAGHALTEADCFKGLWTASETCRKGIDPLRDEYAAGHAFGFHSFF